MKTIDNKQYVNRPLKVFISNGSILSIISGDKIKQPQSNEIINEIMSWLKEDKITCHVSDNP